MTEKMIPLRKCMACRERKEKDKLLRFTKTEEGIFLDPEKKMNGRGAYVCRESACIDLLFKKRGFEKSFHKRVGDDELMRLRKEVDDFIG